MRQRKRLTEQDLNRIIKGVINEVASSSSWANYSGPQVNNYINDQIGNMVKAIMQECQKYINNNDGSALSQLSWLCNSFNAEYNKAWKNGKEIYGGMTFPQQQQQQQ